MLINGEKCVKCGQCLPYCPMNCIVEGLDSMEVDQDECVECGICLRNSGCPVQAFEAPKLQMPRFVRGVFSDPFTRHPNQEGGRGTEEIKTNDVTGVVNSLGRVEIAIEMGRPGIGARFRDVELMTKTVSRFPIEFAKGNPVTSFIIDKKTGQIEPSILNEKILSCIIEFEADAGDLADILDAVREASRRLSTVFSISVICKIDENNDSVVEREIVSKGYEIDKSSSKTNLGLGRPLYEDRVKEGATR